MIHVQTLGTGPDVVCVHGAAGDYRQWLPIAQSLDSTFRVTAYSRQHHWPDNTDAAGIVYSHESHRDDLLKMLRSLDRPVHVVGHSYGAGVALLAALAAPHLVRSLMLMEPAFASLLPSGAPELDAELTTRADMVASVKALSAAGQHSQALEVMFDWVQEGRGGFAGLAEDVRRGLLDNAMTLGPTYASVPPQVLIGEVQRLEMPLAIVNGAQTRPYYRLIGDFIARNVPGATHVVIPTSGHMVIVERAAATAAAIREFLDDAAEG